MVAKRYGKLPSELLPTGTVSSAEALSFNVNVALLGAVAEIKAINKAREGPINSRSAAKAAIMEAKEDWIQWERQRNPNHLDA